jgi:2-amino-4-hydroxy-6-hydroxymethyldihydropteridine diphosphokinase
MSAPSTPHRPGPRIVRAYVGLGANLGDADATLTWAVDALDRRPGIRVRRVSRLYATAPWGVTDQPEFRNAVVAADVDIREAADGDSSAARVPGAAWVPGAALGLLAVLKAIERDAGRRPGPRWGPRSLDLDLLVFGRHRIHIARSDDARSNDAADDPERAARWLEVPHRDARDRLFVLAPLADVAPRLVPPGWSTTVASRRQAVAATEPPSAVRVVGTWDHGARRWWPSTD